jgi:hypothetical protein
MSYKMDINRPSCWNCKRLKKSGRREEISYDSNGEIKTVSIGADSYLDALAGYYCDFFWWGDKPDNEMLCGGRGYKRR